MFTSTLRFGDGSTVSLQRTTVVGRAPDSAPAVVAGIAEPLAIDDDSQLSRHHLQLTVDGAGVAVMDLGSGNGTVVERDGERHELLAMEPLELRSGDVVVFGRQRVLLGLDAEFEATVIVEADHFESTDTPDDPTPPQSPSPATSVLPPQPAPPQPAPPQPAPPQPAPPQPAPPQPAPAVAAGGFVPGRADHVAGQPGFAPGRAAPPPIAAGPYGHTPQPQPQPGGYRMSTTPATFGARLWGTILDGIIYGFVMFAVILLAVGGFFIHPILGTLIGLFGYFGVFFLYWRQLATTGQTWGRRIAKVRVVDARTGHPIGYWKTFLRFFVANISGSIFYLGYLWMLWDDKQQTWHDKAAGSVVVTL